LLCLNCNRTFPITGRMYDLRISWIMYFNWRNI
jgi:hypothetical protein